MSSFVISLDFELFWGVSDTRTVQDYGANIRGDWVVVPKLLSLLAKYNVRVTWATVGMLMCRDYEQWREISPAQTPTYENTKLSPYNLGELAKTHPELFFARPLVQQIIDAEIHEIATHTYSHFYCSEAGATAGQFSSDLTCARSMASELGIELTSIVFPRNQIRNDFLGVLPENRIKVYRGNPDHWLYRDGHYIPGGLAGRALRLADSWLPISGNAVSQMARHDKLTNVPASMFLRPWSRSLSFAEQLKIRRIKQAMTAAASSDRLFHLWWHPHNFGVDTEYNLAMLESVLRHFRELNRRYGMESKTMSEFAEPVMS